MHATYINMLGEPNQRKRFSRFFTNTCVVCSILRYVHVYTTNNNKKIIGSTEHTVRFWCKTFVQILNIIFLQTKNAVQEEHGQCHKPTNSNSSNYFDRIAQMFVFIIQIAHNKIGNYHSFAYYFSFIYIFPIIHWKWCFASGLSWVNNIFSHRQTKICRFWKMVRRAYLFVSINQCH